MCVIVVVMLAFNVPLDLIWSLSVRAEILSLQYIHNKQ